MNHLLACRVCLAYDTRLCSIMDGHFRDIYEKLVEASLDTEDMLPTSVCYICFSLMKKMLQFRDRSQKANRILQQMISSGLESSVSSLDMLVRDQTGISWTLGISNIETTTTNSGEVEIEMKIESVKSEMDIDGMSDRNEDYDYSDSMLVYRDSTSDSEDDLPLQNISEQYKTDRVKMKTLKVILERISGHEGAAPPEKRKLDKNEAGNELGNIQAPLGNTQKDQEPREKKEDTKKIHDFAKLITPPETILKETETTSSNIISEKEDSAINKNDTVTLSKDIFTSDLCKNEYQRKSLLESPMMKSHVIEWIPKDSINSVLDVTNECKITNLLKVQELQNNYNRKENHRRENRFRDNTSRYECQYCMKRFTYNYHLSRHVSVHTKAKPFRCDICQKGFSQKYHLTRHLRVHTNEKPYKCDECKKCFSLKSTLINHSKVHTKEKPFICDICKKGFSVSTNLTKHLRVHTKERPFECNICKKGFSQSTHLTAHLRVHTKEKPYKCDICDKSFSVGSTLISHLKVHTKERPFICDICKKGFSVSTNLTKHLRVHTKEKPFTCDICKKGFSQRAHLTAHLRVHTKEKPYKCDIQDVC